ncbi:hypothetical protein E4N78_07825 [Treponema denticola]|nr:hypothetical protein E4N78_07825 [Treponema denticola]
MINSSAEIQPHCLSILYAVCKQTA